MEGDLRLLQEIVKLFLDGTPALLRDLREAVAQRDARRIASLAHRLRGSVANFRADSAASGAQQLEEMASRGDLGEVDAALASFERATAELMAGLKSLKGYL